MSSKTIPKGRFRFIQGVATSTDFAQRSVTVNVTGLGNARYSRADNGSKDDGFETLPYHALVLATGTSAHSPLLSLHGRHEDTVAALDQFHTGLTTASSVIVVGGGASGVECAGQLATWVNRANKRRSKETNPKQSIRNRFAKIDLRRKMSSDSGVAACPESRTDQDHTHFGSGALANPSLAEHWLQG